MPQTIKIPPPAEHGPARERTLTDAIRLVSDTAASAEQHSSSWAARFAACMQAGISLHGLEGIRQGRDPRDALADSFGLRLGAINAGRDPWGNPGLTNTGHKLARLLIADKAVGLDLSSALPGDADTGGAEDDDVALPRVVDKLRQIVEGLGVEFRPAILALRCDHPGIREFFDLYLDESASGAMLGIKISGEFMEAVRAGTRITLRHAHPDPAGAAPGDGDSPPEPERVYGEVHARALWREFVSLACRTRKVHLILDNCMRPASPLGHYEVTDAVSPYLLQTIPAESAQIVVELDLSRFIDSRGRPMPRALENTVRDGLRLADNLIDQVRWPLDGIKSDAYAYRRVALTVQGIGEAAVKMALDPKDFGALEQLDAIVRNVARCAYRESLALAREREPFPGLRAQDLCTLLPQRGLEAEMRANIRAHGTRNSQILVLGPFSVIPPHCAAVERASFSNFLPLLRLAHTLTFRRPAFLDFMHGEDLAQFLRLSWAYFATGEIREK